MKMKQLSPLVATLLIMAAAPVGAVTPGGESESVPGAVVAPSVLEQLASAGPGDMINIIVTLRNQADLATVAAGTRAERLQEVVELLQATAHQTQAALRDRLSARQAQGLVSRFTPFWVFNGFAIAAASEVVEELASRPEVASVVADGTLQAPRLTSTAAAAETNVSLVNAPALWDLGFTGQGIVVANMDTGVNANHPDLAPSWRGGSNSWFDPNGQHLSTPTDVNGHGTWTMGVMVGGSNGGTAIGIAPGSQWVAVKIFDDSGAATSSDIHAGFQWLLDPDGNPATPDAPNVVNNSWSLGSIGCSLEFQLDLQSLRAAGILPVFAAGNFGPGPSTSASPANNPEAFAVGATNNGDVLYSGGSRGPSACGEPATTFPELVAPGVNVRTTDLFGLYTQQTGTSLAAPHVAGALALLLDGSADLSADVQEDALEHGAVDLGTPGPDNENGYGRVDILASYEWLATLADFTIAVAPVSAGTTPGGSVGFAATVTPVNGFTGAVTLSLSGLAPSQGAWTFAPPTIPGGSGISQLTVTAAASLTPGSYPLTIIGTNGSLLHSVPVTLVVNPTPDFGLSVTPSSQTVKRGASATYTVGVSSQGGFGGTVNLSVTGLPSGVTATFQPGSVPAPGTSTMIVKTTGRAARGTYTLTVTGMSGSTVHLATTTLVVK